MKVQVLVGNDSYAKELYMRKQVGHLLRIRRDDPNKPALLKRIIGTKGFFPAEDFGLCAVTFGTWKKNDQQIFLEGLQSFDYADLVVFIDVVNPLRFPQKRFEELHFELPKPWQDREWVNAVFEIARSVGVNLTTGGARELLKRLGQNKWSIHNELSKLSLLSKEIDVDLIETETPSLEPVQLEGLLRAVATRSKDLTSVAFEVLKDHDALLVVSVLFGFLRDLYLVLTHYSGERVTWELVKSYSLMFNTSASRIATLLGYQFKGSRISETRPVDLWNVDEVEDMLIALQQLEMSIKDGETEPRLGIIGVLSEIL